jgi:hypothetical protein
VSRESRLVSHVSSRGVRGGGNNFVLPNHSGIASHREAKKSTSGGIKETLVGCIFTQIADAEIQNTTDERSMFGSGVGTLTLPANFWEVGKTIKIEIHGDFADTGNPTVRVRAYSDSTALIDSGAITLSNLGGTEEWETTIIMTCRSTGTSGTIQTVIDWEYETTTGSSPIERLDVAGNLAIVDTTVEHVLDATFAWGTASVGNILTSEVAIVEVFN